MTNKITAALLAMLLFFASTCMAQSSSHKHTPSEEWDCNLTTHWRVCACGEAFTPSQHTMNGVSCTVCGCDIWIYEDGSGDITAYTEYFDVARYSVYDFEGSLTDDYRYFIDYDEEGNRLHEEIYWNETLIEVIEYALTLHGYVQPVLQTGYDPEGEWSVNEYDEYGNLFHAASYDAEGMLLFEEKIEYEYDADGFILGQASTSRFSEGDSIVTISNMYGDTTLTAFYNADGIPEFGTYSEYEYDEAGNRLWSKMYNLIDDRLIQESEFAVIEDEFGPWSYEKICTYYEEDNSKYIYEYDPSGNELLVVIYNTEGEVEFIYRSEYEFDENGNVLHHARYENERLHMTRQYELLEDEDGWLLHYVKIVTEIYEDGTMRICEYDPEGNQISDGLFDENGNLIAMDEIADE